jgi:flagellar basal-body rod protein FlgG
VGNFIDIAASVLSQSERRVEIAGQNIANLTTPGYKRRVSFAAFLPPDGSGLDPLTTGVTPDLAAGKLSETGNPYDLAIAGGGFFTINVAGQSLYTRQGQFQRDADGRLVTAQGFAVQAEGGGDIRLKSADFKVLDDGSVVEDGEPVAKLAIVDFANPQNAAYAEGGLLSMPDADVKPAETSRLRQGMLEASNVSMGDEMISMMEALRRAESGQRLAGVYDDLMGRVLNAFAQQ